MMTLECSELMRLVSLAGAAARSFGTIQALPRLEDCSDQAPEVD
jgi:hypothetical protein